METSSATKQNAGLFSRPGARADRQTPTRGTLIIVRRNSAFGASRQSDSRACDAGTSHARAAPEILQSTAVQDGCFGPRERAGRLGTVAGRHVFHQIGTDPELGGLDAQQITASRGSGRRPKGPNR